MVTILVIGCIILSAISIISALTLWLAISKHLIRQDATLANIHRIVAIQQERVVAAVRAESGAITDAVVVVIGREVSEGIEGLTTEVAGLASEVGRLTEKVEGLVARLDASDRSIMPGTASPTVRSEAMESREPERLPPHPPVG